MNLETTHKLIAGDSRRMDSIPDSSVALVVTSPPYPMIQMWDDQFTSQNAGIGGSLSEHDTIDAFRLMHDELGKAWSECHRVLIDGGFLCVNIGDAVSSAGGQFRLYPNHSEVSARCLSLGFAQLPGVIWRKPTNSPNKFMGSGMLPCGAYVTLEHEHILVFRKGGRREFKTEQSRELRRRSALFWEERNALFSDLWEIRGARQSLNASSAARERSAAFPKEIPHRLISMYSVIGDTVLDPFAGIGTTASASVALARNSIGFDIEETLIPLATENVVVSSSPERVNADIKGRIRRHIAFADEREGSGKPMKHRNESIGCGVMTSQECWINPLFLKGISVTQGEPLTLTAQYE